MAAKTYNLFEKEDTVVCKRGFAITMLTATNSIQNPFHFQHGSINNLSAKAVSTRSLSSKLNFLVKNIRAKYFILLAFACLNSLIFSTQANAQTTVVTGPSDNTTAPPTTASAVAQVLASGSAISLKMGSTTTATDVRYQWYKLDNTGAKRLVQDGADNTLKETAAGAGYYTYQLLMSNSNQCTSEISDPFKVYVLPALTPTIAASTGTLCSNGTSTSTLTANPGNSTYSYLYQWSVNGTDIAGANSATYTTPAGTSGNNTYAVKVSYTLNANYGGNASKVINMIPVPSKPAISVGQ
jgi:hypothetical protein